MNIKKLIIAALSSVMITSSAALADGHVKYSVTADNVSEYSSMLTPGMLNMFSAYPETFRMDVYENGGNCTIAPDIAAISQSNGTMINDNEGLELPNAGQVPFPDPSHPQHFVWNYRMYAGTVSAVDRVQTSVTVKEMKLGPLKWVCNNSKKPGRDNDVENWVMHASDEWSKAHVDLDKDTALEKLTAAFFDCVEVKPQAPLFSHTHRWLYANADSVLGDSYLLDSEKHIAVCGDWCMGNRASDAFESGRQLANEVSRTWHQQPVV